QKLKPRYNLIFVPSCGFRGHFRACVSSGGVRRRVAFLDTLSPFTHPGGSLLVSFRSNLPLPALPFSAILGVLRGLSPLPNSPKFWKFCSLCSRFLSPLR